MIAFPCTKSKERFSLDFTCKQQSIVRMETFSSYESFPSSPRKPHKFTMLYTCVFCSRKHFTPFTFHVLGFSNKFFSSFRSIMIEWLLQNQIKRIKMKFIEILLRKPNEAREVLHSQQIANSCRNGFSLWLLFDMSRTRHWQNCRKQTIKSGAKKEMYTYNGTTQHIHICESERRNSLFDKRIEFPSPNMNQTHDILYTKGHKRIP